MRAMKALWSVMTLCVMSMSLAYTHSRRSERVGRRTLDIDCKRSTVVLHSRRTQDPSLRRNNVESGDFGNSLKNRGGMALGCKTSKTSEAAETGLSSSHRMWDELSVSTSRLILLSIAAAYGTNYSAVKTLSDQLDPSVASLLRFGLSSVAFLPFVLKHKATPSLVKSAAEIGALNFCGYFGQAVALNEGLSASAVAFICSLAVVVVPALDALFPLSGERGAVQNDNSSNKNILVFVPSIISALGVGFLTEFGSEAATAACGAGAGGGSALGYMAALLQPLLFGWAYWRQPQLLRKTCSEPGHYLAFTGTSLLAVFTGSAIWAVDKGIDVESVSTFLSQTTQGPNSALLAILWTGLATTAGTTLLENIAMKQLTGTESTVIYSTEPLFATFFGFVLLGEALGRNTVIGGSLIISAILLSVILDEKREGS